MGPWIINAVCLLYTICTVFPVNSDAERDVHAAMSEWDDGGSHVREDGGRHVRERRQTTSDQQSHVDYHNKLRRQEGASNMHKMYLQSDLVRVAAEWAAECKFEHGQPSSADAIKTQNNWRELGQNIYINGGRADNFDADNAIQLWYDEKQYFNYSSITCETNQICGHYTQVVWSNSVYMGCAVQHCNNITSSTIGEGNIFVCNYGPPGNFRGVRPFETGASCADSFCNDYECDDGLCDTLSPITSPSVPSTTTTTNIQPGGSTTTTSSSTTTTTTTIQPGGSTISALSPITPPSVPSTTTTTTIQAMTSSTTTRGPAPPDGASSSFPAWGWLAVAIPVVAVITAVAVCIYIRFTDPSSAPTQPPRSSLESPYDRKNFQGRYGERYNPGYN